SPLDREYLKISLIGENLSYSLHFGREYLKESLFLGKNLQSPILLEKISLWFLFGRKSLKDIFLFGKESF
ncbi:hypothetical protein, partial [Streptomyces clavifer]|uniref:hypothetical protein n=1 Tax=Streptomyces clavifer TaxID=68188 RepID=UPI002381369C